MQAELTGNGEDLPCPARQKRLCILPGQGRLAQEDGQLVSFEVRTTRKSEKKTEQALSSLQTTLEVMFLTRRHSCGLSSGNLRPECSKRQ